MTLWSDLDISKITVVQSRQGRNTYAYNNLPLKFQIPRGLCTWGVGSYKSFQVSISNPEFIDFWGRLENVLCSEIPFVSNMKGNVLRIKIDDGAFIFDEQCHQITPEVQEGLFKGQELSCSVQIDSSYFYNDNNGLVVKASQVRYYSPPLQEDVETFDEEDTPQLTKCSFL